jgi:hypothetical protein
VLTRPDVRPDPIAALPGGNEIVQIDDPASDPRWDAYVREHPHATPYHLAAWARVLAAAYRFKPAHLALESRQGEIRGVLPIVWGNGMISGPRLNSLPGLQWGGPLAATVEDETRLVAAACQRVEEGDARRLGMQSTRSGYERAVPGLTWSEGMPSWRVEMPSCFEDFRKQLKGHSKNAFRSLKKADAAGVSVREVTSEADLKRFYRLYLKTMRRHRSIPRAYKQFVLAWRLLEPAGVMKLLVAEQDGRMLAGGVFNFFGDTVDLMYNASDPRRLDRRPNHAIYADAMRRAIEGDYRYVDFGGSRDGTSLASFKQQWCTEAVPMFDYSFRSAGSEATAERTMRVKRRVRTDDSFPLARAWAHAPLLLTRGAGRLIYSYV